MSELTYPHTHITADLRAVISRLEALGMEELSTTLAGVLTQYNTKNTYFRARVAELENAAEEADDSDDDNVSGTVEYPHTDIGNTLFDLRRSLENSNSPERQHRLDLVDSAISDYAKKREWFVTQPGFNG
jgi:hypothetical protein